MGGKRPAESAPELRIPAIAVVVGTSLIGASAGSLGGPFPAAIFGAVGFAWGVLVVLICARLIRSPRRATFGNVALYAATFATACLTGVGLHSMPIMAVSVDRAPQFFADLVRPPVGDAEALPFYLLNTPLEWLLIPAALLLNVWIPTRRKLILIAAVMFTITLTAFGTPEVAVKAMALGASRILHKPFELDDLATLVEAAVISKTTGNRT